MLNQLPGISGPYFFMRMFISNQPRKRWFCQKSKGETERLDTKRTLGHWLFVFTLVGKSPCGAWQGDNMHYPCLCLLVFTVLPCPKATSWAVQLIGGEKVCWTGKRYLSSPFLVILKGLVRWWSVLVAIGCRRFEFHPKGLVQRLQKYLTTRIILRNSTLYGCFGRFVIMASRIADNLSVTKIGHQQLVILRCFSLKSRLLKTDVCLHNLPKYQNASFVQNKGQNIFIPITV